MSFTTFFLENRDEIQNKVFVYKNLAKDDPANAQQYETLKEFYAVFLQKSHWLMNFEAYADFGALKNALFALGVMSSKAEACVKGNCRDLLADPALFDKCVESLQNTYDQLMNHRI